MKITKLEHACLDITLVNDRLIIDPGVFARSLSNMEGITAVVITHVHKDHFDQQKVMAIIAANPEVHIYTTEQVAAQLPNGLTTVPALGQQYSLGDLILEFFGNMHAIIVDDRPKDQNYGVMVNDKLYYPGDSFTVCPKEHAVLAVPANAPWMKLAESIEFMRQDNAKELFPTHDNFLSEDGKEVTNNLLGGVAEQLGKAYHPLKPGESLDV